MTETKKSPKRRLSREKALCALFQIFLGKSELEKALFAVEKYEFHEEEPFVSDSDVNEPDAFFTLLVKGVLDHQEEIDELLKSNMEKWSLDRIGNVELNVARIAVFELLYQKDETPQRVILNEAIDIVKKYSDDKSGKFINSILQKVISSINQ
ncbi:MAG: nusB [Bacillales bacterium]|nr:nusB [Bacillales bacterium]